MILISHRGNLSGPNPELENNPKYILDAYNAGFNVEIDVWSWDNKFYLGHDEPQHIVDWRFLTKTGLWCHAKNFEALVLLKKYAANCFWHDRDDHTLTSSGYIWTYPGKPYGLKSIVVCTTLENTKVLQKENLHGICSDYVGVL